MTKEEICDLAENYARKYNPDGLSPFPYEKITDDKKDLNIYVSETENNISGAILFVPEENLFRIVVNKNKPRVRQNFTVAHELGHYFLHQDIIKNNENLLVDEESSLDGNNILFRMDAVQSSRVETEANNFAAALIMPAYLVKDAWMTLKNVDGCAKIFNVSVIAMSIRLERLGLI